MIGSLTKRVTFGLALALFALAHSGLIEPVAYADQKSKPDTCFGLEKQLSSAEQALEGGEVGQAVRRLLRLQSSRAECGQVLAVLARLRASQKNVNEAEHLFLRAIALSPDDPDTYFYYS